MKSLFQRSLLFNLLVMAFTAAALVMVLLFSLNTITKHGQDAKVPELMGKKLGEAMKQLDGFEVKIDSIYLPYKDPMEIVAQDPKGGDMVKVGRIIYLTVNKQTPPMISMPALVNMSFRNAVLTLQSYRLIMGDTIFKLDIAAGAVLGQLFNGRPINPGTQIPVGSRVDLVVGAGLSDSIMPVPDLIGKSYVEVRSLLDASGILYNVVWDGEISDTNTAIIYNQQPESKNELDFINNIPPGDMIDIRIMQKPSAELLRMNQAGSRKFLDPNDTNAVITYGPATNELPIAIEGTDAQGNSVTKTTIKPKKKKITTTQEQVNDIINTDNNAPDTKPDAPDTKPDDRFVGPKPPPADNKIDKNKTNLPADKNKNTKPALGKDGKSIKDPKSLVTEKAKQEAAKKKKDNPIKNKNNNDFSDEFK